MALNRDQLWASGHDESVEVNQRALIDKVLARYSGEFTVFRELLQNADDASSTKVEIDFETRRYLDRQQPSEGSQGDLKADESFEDLRSIVVHQWAVKNDGLVFRVEDWNRLKKIAEGNPDEDKIGAFGVGFYALFSITEEPFVTSGDQWMGFYWKDGGDQLFVRRGTLESTSDPQSRKWTSFTLPLRTPSPLPPLFDLARFLTSSLTFMSNLRCVSVRLDGRVVVRVQKDTPGRPLSIGGKADGDLASGGKEVQIKGLRANSPQGLMTVKEVRKSFLFMEAEVARCVYASQAPPKSKPKPLPLLDGKLMPKVPAVTSGFFTSLFSSFVSPSATPTPQNLPTSLPRAITPVPKVEEQKDPNELLKSSIRLTIFRASASVRVDAKLKEELLRATKKNPPASVSVALIYTGKDEYDASKKEDDSDGLNVGTVFQGLRADIEGTGTSRIFIGHATGQTTGIGGHVAARFIPTVERESVDLVDRSVSIWNKELLFVTGFLARAAYNEELVGIQEMWDAAAESSSGNKGSAVKGKEIDDQLRKWLTDRCIHALQFFTFRASTPSSVVSTLVESGFFSCAPPQQHPFYIMSNKGPSNAADVRLPDPTFAEFLKELPVLPQEIIDHAKGMVESLQMRDLLRTITFMDVLKELAARPLGNDELVACLKWWIKVWTAGVGSNDLVIVRTQLIEATLLTTTEKENDEKIIPLSTIRTFVNVRTMGSILPLDGPMPAHTAPLTVSKHFQSNELTSALAWTELTLVNWLQNIVYVATTNNPLIKAAPEFNICTSPHFAERVLTGLSKAWPSLGKVSQAEVVKALLDVACVPTRAGLQKPGDAYFSNAHVFPDLPVVVFPSAASNTKGSSGPAPIRGNMEKLLDALGVRRHVDLQIVFNRMIKSGDWTINELVKYLVAVQQTLTPNELERLRATSAFPKESSAPSSDQNGQAPKTVSAETEAVKAARFRAGELYEPIDVFRNLGLPLIDWGTQTKWRSSSDEAKFLFSLGLQRLPPLDVLLKQAASSDAMLRSHALKYLLDNYSRYPDYNPDNYREVAYVPAVTPSGEEIMAKPHEVFVDPDYSVLGLTVVQANFRDVALDKLKVKKQPPPQYIISLLEKGAPQAEDAARKWFEVLAGRIGDFSSAQLVKLSQMPIVPSSAGTESVTTEKSAKSVQTRMIAPKDCYFRRETSETFHSKLFVFVDFGTKANGFLSACGTKHEPSAEEMVQTLLNDPKRFYRLCGGKDSYLTELKNIAVNRRLLTSSILSRMKKAPILLGSRRVRKVKDLDKKVAQSVDNSLEIDEDEWDTQYDLLKPDSIAIADEQNAYLFFGDAVFTAPQEDILEDFYGELGSPKLTSLIHEDYKTSAEIKDAKVAKDIRALILERTPLFLHELSDSKTRIKYSWLNNDKNFIVRTFGKLTTVKHLYFGATRLSRNQDTSASAKRNAFGPVELWLAGNSQVDMYEVATSLCRLLLSSSKPNDALLFMTILSTDLRSLKRRGYNVDRILKQQRAEREAAEVLRREQAKEIEKLLSDTQPNFPPPNQFPVIPKSTSEPMGTKHEATSSVSRPGSPDPGITEKENRASRPSSTLINSLQGIRKKFGPNRNELPGRLDAGPSKLPPSIEDERPATQLPNPPTSPTLPGSFDAKSNSNRIQDGPPRSQSPHVTPLTNIENNIKQAINGCREEQGNLLKTREEMRMVKESLEDGYCDVSGRIGDLMFIGTMADIKVYITPGIASGSSIMTEKHDAIARFIHVIRPLRTLYKLPSTSIHIFYDLQGETIAFNRNGSIFVNLRYYEGWHDEGVRNGDLSRAYISWFFSLAHEIAHNLVKPHNSEHEFYFSSICEAHVASLGRLLAPS